MTKFTDLNLDAKVLKAIAEAGYESPTPIQAGAIPPALEGRDVLGIAQTGTGKTASFTLPMITLLKRGRARARMPRSLVLCPTRELAAQVAENFDVYAKHTKLTKALLIGGVSFKEQDAAIDRGVDVLIATPGRLIDHFERGKLLLTGVQVMVVDEADRMLDMGFIPDIERIFNLTPFTRQTLFFSATMAPEIERITNTFLQAPAKVEIARQATASERIEQHAVMFKASRKDRASSEKRKVLRALIDAQGDTLQNAVIFCNRKSDVDICFKSLSKYGYDAAPIHGDLDQSQRNATLDKFRAGEIKLLVASDVAARGLDVPSVTHVFNYDVPGHPEDYVHRIGRTGRAGRDGKAIMIVEPRDEKNFDAVEKLINKEIPRLDNPVKAPEPKQKPEDADNAEKPKRTRTRRKKSGEPVAEATQEAAPKVEKQPEQKPRQSRGRSQRRDRDNDVIGMGDDAPAFIRLSFAERRAAS
ncbi:DEAD/DEAH box helicase [Marivivens niveibacter]|uniref:DEAD-box ATP-dependent RNA helicase RhpA n=1 Tax=Marivivens niveibacter TaxID=1930667 RepID=A0A251WXJ7_9RHOB|nr:DEAD/DEAH box helicase [Marivivens niveibacter]OUD08683.1 DEAD/DEAH box helicase [Marivivens niveibacter]